MSTRELPEPGRRMYDQAALMTALAALCLRSGGEIRLTADELTAAHQVADLLNLNGDKTGYVIRFRSA